MSKYGDLIKKAKEPENQKTSEPEKMVNLCIKVPESQRRHWVARAKEQGLTITSVIVEALTEKFSLPENQKARKE
ncbi:MAG: hypothetical protein AAF378_25180 [Cyanobacteria bacterium P01_A01_bin.84]